MGQTGHEEFARWLRAELRACGWMVSDFASAVGVRPSAVYRWTAGQRAPADAQVARIAAVLQQSEATLWEILGRSGVPPSQPAPPAAAPVQPPISPPPTPPPGPSPFALWLRSQLTQRGWTTGLLARRLDLDPVTVRAWALGRRLPASVLLPHLARALAVEEAFLRQLIAASE